MPAATLLGVALAAGTLVVIALTSGIVRVEIAAVVLAIVYAIYIGIALTRAEPREFLTELGLAVTGFVLVGLGLWHSTAWLVVGYLLHGVWDPLHHRQRHVLGVRGVPTWYVPTCLAYDWIVGIGLLFLL